MAAPALISDTRDAPALPARRLVLAPRGTAEPFPSIGRVVELARARRRFALVVPTKPALEHVKNEVARLAGSVDPLRFYTALGLAKRILGVRAPRLATPRERDILLERALRALAPENAIHLELQRAARFRGFRRALLHLFAEVEALGADPRGLASVLRRAAATPYSQTVHARIVEAFRAFKSELARADVASEPELLARAARLVEAPGSEPALNADFLVVDGFVELAPKQLELLLAVAARVPETEIYRSELQAPDQPFRKTLVGRGFEIIERTPARTPEHRGSDQRGAAIEHVIQSLFVREAQARPTTDGVVSFVRAGSPADEALSALKIARAAVLERGRRWNDVLVVVPDARAVRSCFERAAAELEVPIRVHGARPLVDHPAVRGALAFVRAAATRSSEALVAAAAAPALGLAQPVAEALAREIQRNAARSLDTGTAGSGGAGSAGGPLAGLEPRARGFVREVLELGSFLRSGASADAALQAIRRALHRRLRGPVVAELSLVPDQATLEAAADEVAALQGLDGLLAELAGLLRGEARPRDGSADGADPIALLERIEAEAAETDYTPRDRRRLVVHVVDVAEARSWRASVAIVCGLTEGAFPRPWRNDLLLDDGVRGAFARVFGAGLLTSDEHAERERQLFLHAVSCARDELHLVHAAFDDRGEPCVPSPFVAAVESLFAKEALEKAQRKRAPSDVIPQSTSEIVTFADARRFASLRAAATFRPGSEQDRRARLGAALLERVLDQPGEIDRARRALARPTWTLQHGAGHAALEHVYSASELETFASCPYRHFVQHVLGARRRDELAVTGLDSRLQGKIVHRALERAVLLREAPEAAFDAAFAEVARDLPLGPDEESFRRSARASIAAFLVEDDPRFLARTGLQTSQVEVQFGASTPAGPLVVEDPALGGAIRLEGRIDRIDEGPRGAFVTDYKLGKDELDGKAREAMARGEKLQLQVYMLAVARVLGKQPLGASLVALRSRRRTGIVRGDARDLAVPGGGGGSIAINPVDLDRLLADAEESIRRVVREIARGRIDARPKMPKDCKRCDVRDVCRFRDRTGGRS